MAGVLLITLLAAAQLEPAELDTFFGALERAIDAGDRPAVTARIRFPITVSFGVGLRVPFATPEALVERYDDIFTPELRAALRDSLHLERAGGELKITSIAVPRRDPSRAAGIAPQSGPPARSPRRIGVRGGPKPTQFAGSLAAGTTDTYLLFVPKGQLVDVRLQRGREEATVRVVHAASGKPLAERTAAGAPVVIGRAAEQGDYRIEVRHTGPPGAPALPYMLAIAMK